MSPKYFPHWGNQRGFGFLGRNALYFEEELKAASIETDFVQVSGRTRTNIKVIDKSNLGCTEINEPDHILTLLVGKASKESYFVGSEVRVRSYCR